MSAFFEIAYAVASDQLCLFTGTGFSKAVTEGAAPSWKSLLETMCDELDDPGPIKAALFPAEQNSPLSLEESAQIIAMELSRSGKDIRQEIAKKIKAVKLAGDNSPITDFLRDHQLRIVTTNYDMLAEELADPSRCHSITPGHPIPRSHVDVTVYHVHGSVASPPHMVVTADDYYKFMKTESYFSRKLSTLLHENTIVILGYSLSDTNLKAIINDYKEFSRRHAIGGNLFLVSRRKVDQRIKDYYSHSYGIRVMDRLEVNEFFRRITASMQEAEECRYSIKTISDVLFNGYSYTDDYLKVESSFFEIIASVAAIGRSINDPSVVTAIDEIIERKIRFTEASGAWEQYEHLACWLAYLGSILELSGTSIKDTFLNAVLRSMSTMSRLLTLGYSWHAYDRWSKGWPDVLPFNRAMIAAHIKTHTTNADALEIVSRG